MGEHLRVFTLYSILNFQLFSFPPSDDSRPDSPVRNSSSDLIVSDVVPIKKLLIQLQVDGNFKAVPCFDQMKCRVCCHKRKVPPGRR